MSCGGTVFSVIQKQDVATVGLSGVREAGSVGNESESNKMSQG